MGQTRRSYSVWEVALSVEDGADHAGGERKKVGDIIALRRPGVGIGRLEGQTLLWLRLTGLEDSEMRKLKSQLVVAGVAQRFDKRRYCIPLHRIAQRIPSFDVARALNLSEWYQPFLMADEDPPYQFLTTTPAFRVEGLVFDKVRGEYL